MKFPSPFYRWRPHPWHGLEVGPNPPQILNAYIEITPFDLVKYEVDKETGYLRVDRPQRSSSQPPTLYGFVPRTFCGERVGNLSPKSERGDGDPLDICVISERPINKSEIILNARVVGGIQMIDGGEADDKIIAVLSNDNNLTPGQERSTYIEDVYDVNYAIKVIKASLLDYEEMFGG